MRIRSFLRSLDGGGICTVGNRLQAVTHTAVRIGIVNDQASGGLLIQIANSSSICRVVLEIEGRLLASILEALGGHEDLPELAVLLINKVDVSCGYHRLIQGLPS